MPLYEYVCPENHAHVELFKADVRPDAVPCDRCPETARYILSAPARGIVVGTTTPGQIARLSGDREGFTTTYDSATIIVREKGSGLIPVAYRCDAGHEWEDDYEVKPGAAPVCPTCGAASRERAVAPQLDWFTATYPHGGYFPELGVERDPATGQVRGQFVASASEMRRICQERGLVILSSDECVRGIDDMDRRASVAARKDEETFNALMDAQRHGPDRAAFALADAVMAETASEHAAAADAAEVAAREAAAHTPAPTVLHSPA